MSRLLWSESLSAPASIATRESTAVAVVEDPGVVEIHLAPNDPHNQIKLNKMFGVDLPMTSWHSALSEDRRIIATRPWRWTVLLPREKVPALLAAFEDEIPASAVSDHTGGFTAFRIVGLNAHEILMRVCSLDLKAIENGQARGTRIAGVKALLLHEESSVPTWTVLVPRSYGAHVSGALVEAARTPGRLALFEPAAAPQV